jgi:hypothetical protein
MILCKISDFIVMRSVCMQRFADMTEFLREEEAAEALELGVMEPLMNVWEESYDHTKRDNVWGWLQATKEVDLV